MKRKQPAYLLKGRQKGIESILLVCRRCPSGISKSVEVRKREKELLTVRVKKENDALLKIEKNHPPRYLGKGGEET